MANSNASQQSSTLSRTPTPQTPSSSGTGGTTTFGHGRGATEWLPAMMMERKPSLGTIPSYPTATQQQHSSGVVGQGRPFSYPAPGSVTTVVESCDSAEVVQSQLIRGRTATSGSSSPFQSHHVQQALADSSTSSSTTPTTASSVGGGSFAQFNGHLPPVTRYTPSNSTSPPSAMERKTPLSAPVGRANELMRFDTAFIMESQYNIQACNKSRNMKQPPQQQQRKRKADKTTSDGGEGGAAEQHQQTRKKTPKVKGIGGGALDSTANATGSVLAASMVSTTQVPNSSSSRTP